MSNVFHDFLAGQPILLLFLVLGLGYLIGNIKAFGIILGAVGGVLLAGLLFGHFGFTIPATAQTFGFVLFIFCVGFQAGPRFFDVLMTSGLKYLSLAPVEALGGVTGSMTSGAALRVVTEAAESNAPALGYTGAYAFANVILTLAGTLIMLI